MDQDIDSLVKEMHSSNSTRPPNRDKLIPLNILQYFKSEIFELNDRKISGATFNGLVLQATNIAHLNFISKTKKD